MGSYRLDTDGKLNILSISLVATTSLQIEDTNERYYKARVEIDSSVKIACGHRMYHCTNLGLQETPDMFPFKGKSKYTRYSILSPTTPSTLLTPSLQVLRSISTEIFFGRRDDIDFPVFVAKSNKENESC